jgi:hypothetical protein
MRTRISVAFSLLLILLLPQLYALNIYATNIFSDGFESGDLSAWTGTHGNPTVTSGNAVEGTYKTVLNTSPAYFYKIISGENDRLWFRVYVNFSVSPTAGEYCRLMIMGVQGVANIVELAVQGGSPPHWACRFYNGSYGDYVTSTTTADALIYHCLEINVNFSSAGGQYDGGYAFYVDGSELTDLRAPNCDTGSRYIDTISCDEYCPIGTPPTIYYDSCAVADSYIGPIPEDTVAPTFGSIGTNTTLAGRLCTFSCLVNDDTNVSTYIFSTNNTGVWTNDTAIIFSSFFNDSAAWANVTKTLNDTVGNVVSYLWYGNDTSNNWSNSDQYNLTTSALQRYLTVASPYGTPGGQGWYNDGSTAHATLDTGIVDHGNGTRRVFTSWSGDATGTSFSQSDPITLDENKTAIAIWRTQYYFTFTHSGLDSSASGSVVTVNGAPVTYDQLPYSFWADSDSVIAYSYYNVSSTTTGKRFTLTGVSGPSSPITLTEPTIVTGDYGTQYEVTFDQTGVEADFTGTVITIATVDYSRTDLPVSFWWDKDSAHNFSFASPLLVNANKQYEWNTTSGLSTLQSEALTITASGSIVGNYLVANRITFDQVGVSSDFTGTILEVDGTLYTANMLPVSFMWEAGSVHTFTYFSPLVVNANAKRYVWTNTSGLSNLQSDTVTVTIYGSIVGNYKNQYYLTATSSYGTPNGGGWYNSGTAAYAGLDTGTVDHGNGTRRVFAAWSGDVSGTDYVQSNPILMDGPKNAVANWRSQYLLEVVIDPFGLTPPPTREPAGEDGSPGWWYDTSTDVSLTAQSITRYNFTNWDVDGTFKGDGVNPISLTMNGPYTAKAHYTALPAPVHDVAVTKITFTKTVLGQGLSVSINVTIENQGDISEDFNVTIYANSTQIEKQSVSSLGSKTTIILTFTWNTSSFEYGNYTITVSADVVANETDTADNNLSTYIVLTIRGDINGDFVVDIFDAIRLAGLFNLNEASPNWNPNADINGDGTIDIYDAILLSGNFGKKV